MDEQLHDAIQFYLYKERVLDMPSPFDAFFSKEAIEARKQKQVPTEAEELARQHRSDVLEHLTNFASVWPRPEITEVAPGVFEGGVKEIGERPPSMLVEYRAAEHKDTAVIAGNGWSLSRDEFDNVQIRTSHGTLAIPSTEWANFVRAVMTIPQGQEIPTAYGYQGGHPVITSSNVTPARKSQTELVAEQTGAAKQNAERMEYSVRMQRQTGIWGSTKRDGR